MTARPDQEDPPSIRPSGEGPSTEPVAEDVAIAIEVNPESYGKSVSRKPWHIALLFVLPYFLLMMCWAFSNPPGAAPDEPDHLVKALGMARLDIGTTYTGPALGSGNLGQQRNASISRVIVVPSNLAPAGFTCEAFKPASTAACVPAKTTTSTAPRAIVDPLGSYPPFLYVPMGWVASMAHTAAGAFLLARVFCAIFCCLLMFLGAAHLVRWLGQRALLGAFIGFTPMVVFCTSIVSTSGIEISSAFGVACVVVAAIRHPNTLRSPGTQFLLMTLGAVLVLSRQLGVVTFGLLMVLLVIRLGWRFIWDLLRHIKVSLVVAIAGLLVAVLAVAYWERQYDHPGFTGPALSSSALGSFVPKSYGIVVSGIAKFGWVDTAVPAWFVAIWILLCVTVVGMAAMVGYRADRWTLFGWFLTMVIVAYVTYATVFYPVQAGVQGRHMLAFFMLLPVLAGLVIVERFDEWDPASVRRLFVLVACIMPLFQAASIYINARRYAVGTHGPVWFLGSAKWSPPLGWPTWLALAAVGALVLVAVIWEVGIRRRPADNDLPTATDTRLILQD